MFASILIFWELKTKLSWNWGRLKTLKRNNSLKITTDDGQLYKFLSLSKATIAYKSLVALWKNVSEYAKDAISEEDPDEESEDEPEEIPMKEEYKGTSTNSL